MTRMAAAITVSPRRTRYIGKTLVSLSQAGVSCPMVCVDEHERGSWLNLLVAIRSALELRPNMVLIFQDDIQVTRGLFGHHKPAFESIVSQRKGIVSLFTPAAYHNSEPGWHPAERMPHSYGAQALLIPGMIATWLLNEPPEHAKTFASDFTLAKWLKQRKLEWYLHSPSFVLHTGEISSLANPCESAPEYRQCRYWLPAIGEEPVEVLSEWQSSAKS